MTLGLKRILKEILGLKGILQGILGLKGILKGTSGLKRILKGTSGLRSKAPAVGASSTPPSHCLGCFLESWSELWGVGLGSLRVDRV